MICFKETLNITFIMNKLNTSRVFGTDINDERYFDLAKDLYERYGGLYGDNVSEFSPEFQKKFIFNAYIDDCITDKTEFSGDNLIRSVHRSSHVRKYCNDVFAQVLSYTFRFVANNSIHVEVKIDNYTRIAEPNCFSRNWEDLDYFEDVIDVNIDFD